jgi:mannosyltransferase
VSLVLLLIFLLGLSLRIYCLDCSSLWFDEVTSISYYAHDWGQVLGSSTFLYHFLVWLPSQFVDPASTAFFVRLPSALAGTFTPLVVYALGRELFGWGQGLVAAGLTAVAAQLLRYSQEARPYAVLTLLAAIGVYCLIRLARTRSWRWWWGFVASCVGGITYSNIGLTVLMPTLSVAALWVLLSSGLIDLRRRSHLIYSLVALSVGLLALVLLIPRLGRALPDVTRLTINDFAHYSLSSLVFYARLDAGGGLAAIFWLGLLVLATFGLYIGFRQGARFGVYTCLLLILVPFTLLTLFSTEHTVFERYVLFAISFYYLLVSNGLVSLLSFGLLDTTKQPYRYLLRAGALTVAGLVGVLFLLGTYFYSTPIGRGTLSERPDFRGPARYLAEHANPEDVMVFVGGDSTTTDFYWKYKPPAHSYSAIDPRLFRQEGSGAIYWVSVYGTLREPIENASMWTEVEPFEGVMVTRDRRPASEIVQAYESFLALLEKHSSGNWPSLYRGSVQQAQGETDSALRNYLLVGTTQSYGDQYIELAKSFESRQEHDKAWWATLLSKSMQPGNPRLHGWLAELLAEEGYHEESQIEQTLAKELQNALRGDTSPEGDSP